MMGSSRTNEKGKAPAAVNPLIEVNNEYAAHGLTLLEGNVEDDFDFVPDMELSLADWKDINGSVAKGIPETNWNPRVYSTNPNPNSFQNPQIDMSSNTANTILQEVPLLPDWNTRWVQQCMNQGHNVISTGGVSIFGGESKFANLNRPQVIRDTGGSSSIFHPRDTGHTAPVHIQKNVNFNTGQTGVQGKAEGSFLSLGIGGTEEAISRSQLGSREISDKSKEEASTELKIAHARQTTGQTSVQTLDPDFIGLQRNISGFSSQFSYGHQVPLINNEIEVHHTVNSGLGTSPHHIFPMQQNEKQHCRNLRSGDLDHYRADKLKETALTELKITHARKATSQTSGQTLDAGFMGFQHNNSGFSNQFSHINRMSLTNNEVGVHGTPHSGPASNPYQILQMQQNDMQHGRNIRSGDLDQYRMLAGNQAVHSGTLGGNSTHFFNSQQHTSNNIAPEYAKPSWVSSCTPSGQLQNTRFRTANSVPSRSSMNSPSLGLGSSTRQNSAAEQRQLIAQNAMHTRTLGSNLFSQKTAAPQVSWVGTGSAGIDDPFPKRLGVEFNGRNSLQAAHRHISPMGTSLQTSGQAYQLPDKGSTRQPVNVLRPSIDGTDGAPVSYPLNSQEPFFALGQSQDALVQLRKDSRRTPPTNGDSQDPLIQHRKDSRVAPSTDASTVDGLSQKADFHSRPPHKRTTVGPHPASHWVQRQKIIHPTSHHPMPKSAIPVTTALVHSSIPAASRAQLAGPVAARIHHSVPCTSHSRPSVPVTTGPVVSHITWKDPDTTAKLSGYKCFLCKRDLALTSEGPVYQPTVPPPVAVLPCGHTFHDQCLQNITPNDQAKDPPCIPCAIGEN